MDFEKPLNGMTAKIVMFAAVSFSLLLIACGGGETQLDVPDVWEQVEVIQLKGSVRTEDGWVELRANHGVRNLTDEWVVLNQQTIGAMTLHSDAKPTLITQDGVEYNSDFRGFFRGDTSDRQPDCGNKGGDYFRPLIIPPNYTLRASYEMWKGRSIETCIANVFTKVGENKLPSEIIFANGVSVPSQKFHTEQISNTSDIGGDGRTPLPELPIYLFPDGSQTERKITKIHFDESAGKMILNLKIEVTSQNEDHGETFAIPSFTFGFAGIDGNMLVGETAVSPKFENLEIAPLQTVEATAGGKAPDRVSGRGFYFIKINGEYYSITEPIIEVEN